MAKLVVKCMDMTNDGVGVAYYNNLPVYIPNFIVGEEAQIQIVAKGYNKYFGKVVELYTQNDYRVNEECKFVSKCGGCQLQHLSYEGQLKFKLNVVNKLFSLLGHQVNEIVGMDKPLFYRNKIMAPIKNNERVFFAFKSRKFNKIDTCLIENYYGQKIIKTLLSLELDGLEYVYIRVGETSKDVLVCLVTKRHDDILDSFQIETLVNKYPTIKTITQSIKTKNTNRVLGEELKILYGDGFIKDFIHDICFKISTNSFYQINSKQTQKLYDLAIDFASLSSEDTVLDAYCGVGTISNMIARKVKKVEGVEIVEDAINNAIENSKLNNITNTTYYCEDATAYILNNKNYFDVIFVDPPRKGCSDEFLNALLESEAKKIIYISCNPETLVLNLQVLLEKYELKNSILVDMFPQTHHVETVVLLEKKA